MTGDARAAAMRVQRRLNFTLTSFTDCAHPVPHYGGGGGSRYYGPSYRQCERRGVWQVFDDSLGRHYRYCSQHARKIGLLNPDGTPIEGVSRV